MTVLYYVQDGRDFVGNSMLWWCHDGRGYTTDLAQAGQYDHKPTDRDTDILWPVEYINSIATLNVDMQKADRNEAKKVELGITDQDIAETMPPEPGR